MNNSIKTVNLTEEQINILTMYILLTTKYRAKEMKIDRLQFR